uniref:Uncharacterized protein n=1 Tax=Romanomermis culicivorax TaxID=13658 RepID=A0A915KK50_ROMCU
MIEARNIDEKSILKGLTFDRGDLVVPADPLNTENDNRVPREACRDRAADNRRHRQKNRKDGRRWRPFPPNLRRGRKNKKQRNGGMLDDYTTS